MPSSTPVQGVIQHDVCLERDRNQRLRLVCYSQGCNHAMLYVAVTINTSLERLQILADEFIAQHPTTYVANHDYLMRDYYYDH